MLFKNFESEDKEKSEEMQDKIIKDSVSQSDYLLVRFYTEELNQTAIKKGSIAVLVDNLRFFLIQNFISGFQLMRLPQVLFIFMVNSIYLFFYFSRISKLGKKKGLIYRGKK